MSMLAFIFYIKIFFVTGRLAKFGDMLAEKEVLSVHGMFSTQ